MTRVAAALVALAVITLVGTGSACFELDSFVLNGRHCSTVTGDDVALCEQRSICSPCDEGYDWASVGIDPAVVTQTPVAVEGGENDAYFIDAGADVTALYAHGNFGGIEHYLNRVGSLFAMGLNVFPIDYRGFGKSSLEGEPTEEQFMADARAARARLDAVLAERGASPAVVVFGFSAGALAAVEIARSSEGCALVLEAPWPSVQALADDSTFVGVPQSFVTDGAWDNVAKMPQVEEPLLHLHGTKDVVVRHELGIELVAAANEPKTSVIVEGAEHGNFGFDLPTAMGAGYAEAILAHVDTFCR